MRAGRATEKVLSRPAHSKRMPREIRTCPVSVPLSRAVSEQNSVAEAADWRRREATSRHEATAAAVGQGRASDVR